MGSLKFSVEPWLVNHIFMCSGEVEELNKILKPAIHRLEVMKSNGENLVRMSVKHTKADLIEYLHKHHELKPQKYFHSVSLFVSCLFS